MNTVFKKIFVLALIFILFFSMLLLVETRHTALAQGSGTGRLAFISQRDGGDWDIFVMNADGSNPTNLTNNAVDDEYPDWSPSGTQIAFESQRDGGYGEIYVMNADGSNPTRLTNHSAWDVHPDWSPDGTQIAFVSYRDGNPEIYVMNADGSNPTNLTNHATEDFVPNWSPDGTQIAFLSRRDGGDLDIFVMNADGSNPTNLTNNAVDEDYPGWSPSGTQIAFASNRDGNWDIFVMNADGSNPTNLTNNAVDEDYPDWSPDGTQITLTRNGDIFAIDADGSNETNLTNNPARDEFSDWYGETNTGGCFADSPATIYQGDTLSLTLQCDDITENVFGFQVGHEITAGAGLVTPQASIYTAGTIFQGQTTLVGSNTLLLYALSLQAGGTEATGDFTLGSVDYTAIAPGQVTFDLINLILGDIDGNAIPDVQASPSAATVTIEDLILSLSGSVDPQGYAHADNLTFELEGSPVYANLIKTFVPADGTTDFSYTNIKGHSDWLQVDGPSHVTCREMLTFPTDAGNETLPSELILRAGDVNGDNAIDLTDATAIGQQYGQPASGELDINHDGTVNILDLIHVGRNYNTTGPTNCTP